MLSHWAHNAVGSRPDAALRRALESPDEFWTVQLGFRGSLVPSSQEDDSWYGCCVNHRAGRAPTDRVTGVEHSGPYTPPEGDLGSSTTAVGPASALRCAFSRNMSLWVADRTMLRDGHCLWAWFRLRQVAVWLLQGHWRRDAGEKVLGSCDMRWALLDAPFRQPGAPDCGLPAWPHRARRRPRPVVCSSRCRSEGMTPLLCSR